MPVQTIVTEGDGIQTFAEWIQRNSRLVAIGAALIVVGALGFWFYLRSGEIKRQNAERGLNQAKQSLAAGNAALAITDLERVATRYTGTPAGVQSAMLLAQLHYDQAKFDEGLQVLEPYQSERAAGANHAAVWALIADGQLAKGEADAAAASYRKAADATELTGAKALHLAKAARSLTAAGKTAEAITLWQTLLDDPQAVAVHNEAEVRLGELQAKAMGTS